MKLLITLLLAFIAAPSIAQSNDSIYIGIYKTSDEKEAESFTRNINVPFKIIKSLKSNELIISIGPYKTIESAKKIGNELNSNSRKISGQDLTYIFLSFKNNNDSNANLFIENSTLVNSASISPKISSFSNGLETTYNIPLTHYGLEVGGGAKRNAGYCNINVYADKNLLAKYNITNPYEITITLSNEYMDDVLLNWNNQASALSKFSNTNDCYSKGEIYISEIYANEWQKIEEEFNSSKPESSECLKHGMKFRNLPYQTSRIPSIKKYPSTKHPVSVEVITSCLEVTKMNPKLNYECKVGATSRITKCNDSWVKVKDKKYFKLSNYNEIIEAKLSGDKIEIVGFETENAKSEYQSLVAATEAQKLTDENNRKKWLESAEGKKYIAEELDRKKKSELNFKLERASINSYNCTVSVEDTQRQNNNSYKTKSDREINIEFSEKLGYVQFTNFGFAIGQKITNSDDQLWGKSFIHFTNDYVEAKCKNCRGLGPYAFRFMKNSKKLVIIHTNSNLSSDAIGTCTQIK